MDRQPETPEQFAARMRRQINADLPRRAPRKSSALRKRTRRARAAVLRAVFTRGLDFGAVDLLPDHFDRGRVAYEACDPLVAWRALRTVPRAARGTLVDFGCGRGLALHLAANLGFREVVGVEVNAKLAAAARSNAEAGGHAGVVSVVIADAASWQVPDEMTTAFLNCPFTGRTFAAWLDRVRESLDRRPRALTIVYVYPFEEQQLLDAGFRVVRRRARASVVADRWAVFSNDLLTGT